MNIWEGSHVDTGRWTPANEQWFQGRLEYIRNGTAKMHNAAQWRSSLRRKPSPLGFQRAVEVSANQFLLVKLHVPLRDMADG